MSSRRVNSPTTTTPSSWSRPSIFPAAKCGPMEPRVQLEPCNSESVALADAALALSAPSGVTHLLGCADVRRPGRGRAARARLDALCGRSSPHVGPRRGDVALPHPRRAACVDRITRRLCPRGAIRVRTSCPGCPGRPQVVATPAATYPRRGCGLRGHEPHPFPGERAASGPVPARAPTTSRCTDGDAELDRPLPPSPLSVSPVHPRGDLGSIAPRVYTPLPPHPPPPPLTPPPLPTLPPRCRRPGWSPLRAGTRLPPLDAPPASSRPGRRSSRSHSIFSPQRQLGGERRRDSGPPHVMCAD